VIPGKVVSLLEILRVHADAYTSAAYAVALINFHIEQMEDFRDDAVMVKRILGHLRNLLPHCGDLPNTQIQVRRVLSMVENLEATKHWEMPKMAFLTSIAEIQSRLTDELSARLYFGLPSGRAQYFSNAREGWEEVIDRFPDTVSDIEEMAKCFALSRYPAAVFHSLLIVETGVIALGDYIDVTDPKRGWDATTKALKVLVDGGHPKLPPKFAGQFGFLEQMNTAVQAMKFAWRNKVNHVEGKLVVMKPEFAPDVAEEIMMTSRSFMRRLATELPK
jgi:hypothetical protein